jgi:hypothetical protein
MITMQKNSLINKIGIITHHNVHNHGAQLQLNALKMVLESKGFNVVVLDYNKNYDFYSNDANSKYNISIKSIPFYIKYIFKYGIKRTMFNIHKRKLLNISKKLICNNTEFYTKSMNLDLVIVGSDEVFSIETGLNPFFWGHGVPSKRIISYAASFGPTDMDFINSKNAYNFIKSGVAQFDKISVRDINSQNIISALSTTIPPIVVDPVLLYGYDKELSASISKRKIKRPYILIYSYDNNMNDKDEIVKIISYARLHGLKLVSGGFFHSWCDYNINVDAFGVLELFKNADLVITDTFHGTIISLITKRNFAVKIRNNSNKLAYLLEQYDLLDRITDSFTDLDKVFSYEINYTLVDLSIRSNVNQSMQFLDSILMQHEGRNNE